MHHYDMDVLTAATIFFKCAQDPGTGITDPAAAKNPKAKIIALSNMLANPNPIANPDATNIRTAYISTLQQEVLKMTEQDTYPISRPESKSAVKVLYNQVKAFHTNLTKPIPQTLQQTSDQQRTQVNSLISDFQRVVNAWGNYSSRYLSDDFFGRLQLDKSSADQTTQQDFTNRILFWKELVKRINETVVNINKMLKDMLVGNPNNPLATTPLQPTPV